MILYSIPQFCEWKHFSEINWKKYEKERKVNENTGRNGDENINAKN